MAHGKSNEKDQLWFLIMGLSYGQDAVLKKQKMVHKLLNKYFGGFFCKMNLGQFKERFADLLASSRKDLRT